LGREIGRNVSGNNEGDGSGGEGKVGVVD